MSKQITLDDDVYFELVKKAVDLNMVFCSANDVLKVLLNNGQNHNLSENFPSSKRPEIQKLLNGLKDIIFAISSNGMTKKKRKWVADPNVVTITVQDARSRNIRITVYGRPYEFSDFIKDRNSGLVIQDDMAGYSRFTFNNEKQLPYVIGIIKHSFKLKKQRGRL